MIFATCIYNSIWPNMVSPKFITSLKFWNETLDLKGLGMCLYMIDMWQTNVGVAYRWMHSINNQHWKWYQRTSMAWVSNLEHQWNINNYTKYDIYCHVIFNVTMVTIRITHLMNKWNFFYHGWWMSSSIHQYPTFSWHQLVMNIVMDDWNLDENTLGKWQ